MQVPLDERVSQSVSLVGAAIGGATGGITQIPPDVVSSSLSDFVFVFGAAVFGASLALTMQKTTGRSETFKLFFRSFGLSVILSAAVAKALTGYTGLGHVDLLVPVAGLIAMFSEHVIALFVACFGVMRNWASKKAGG